MLDSYRVSVADDILLAFKFLNISINYMNNEMHILLSAFFTALAAALEFYLQRFLHCIDFSHPL